MSRAKMTPGPWPIKSTSHGTWIIDFGDQALGFVNEANARAIAYLPELIEAARALLTAADRPMGIEEGRKGRDVGVRDNLRRILARIDGE